MLRDFVVRQPDQFLATAAHLDSDVPQAGPVEAKTGRLAVHGTTQIAKFESRAFSELCHLKLLDLLRRTALRGGLAHKIILARICFIVGLS